MAGSTLPQFTPTRIAQSYFAGDVDQKPDLVLPRLFALVMIQMARVVAELVDVRGDGFGQAIVLLQVDRQIGACVWWRISASASASFLLSTAIRTTSAPARARSLTCADRGRDVLRVRGRHALHGDRMPGADRHRADPDRTRWITDKLHEIVLWMIRRRLNAALPVQEYQANIEAASELRTIV